jgi:hypothetical protein
MLKVLKQGECILVTKKPVLGLSQFGTWVKWDSRKNQRVHGIQIFAAVSGFVFLDISILVT